MKNLLHIYAQALWHDTAEIVGSRGGLEALRDAINAALARADGASTEAVFAADGEGYCVLVALCDEQCDLRLPYTDMESMGLKVADGKTAADILGGKRYRELLKP